MAANSRNLQALKNSTLAAYPGMTFYTWPDPDHMDSRSDHNWDDDNLLTDQTDSDSDEEIRAGDLMIGPKFTKDDAYAVVNLLLKLNRSRIYYIIFDGHIWHSKRGFVREVYTGTNKHTDHAHVSTLAAQDNNSAPWIVKVEESMALEGNDLKRSIATNTRLETLTAMEDRTPINWDNVEGNYEDNVLVQTLKRIDVKTTDLVNSGSEVMLTHEQLETLITRVTAAVIEGLQNGAFKFVESGANDV